ncbi:hypothetical protein VNO80_08975 [Phaseolus coccineus]|uniref:Uncharacterized protein n=1 Tax=Phaseolus coccineus TaxID=3886 RepID=A0AAN9N755_PHACN
MVNSNSNCISIGIVRVRIPQQIAEKLAKTTVVITEGAREQPSKALSYSTQSTLVVTKSSEWQLIHLVILLGRCPVLAMREREKGQRLSRLMERG